MLNVVQYELSAITVCSCASNITHPRDYLFLVTFICLCNPHHHLPTLCRRWDLLLR